MKGKRLLSLVISAAMTLTAFSGFAVTSASAEVGDAANSIWDASTYNGETAANTVLYDDAKGTLTTLFDMTKSEIKETVDGVETPTPVTVGARTFTHYMSHPTMNGSWSGTSYNTSKTTIFKFVPKANGVITAYLNGVGDTKIAYISKEGAEQSASPAIQNGAGASMALSAQLTANETYYVYVAGSKGRFMAIDYEVGATYTPVTPTVKPVVTIDPNAKIYDWAVSANDVGKKAGDLLMTGLSVVCDNTGTSAYVTGADNFELETKSGAALKFVAPEDGTLSVTFKDLGNLLQTKTAYIYDDTAAKPVYEYTTKGEAKETFDATASVKAGQTYYIYGDGTKARFAAAKFTPGKYVEATPTPVPTNDPNAKSWNVSEPDLTRKAGDLLMKGLTLIFDNMSDNKKYITGANNGKIDKNAATPEEVVTGTALKFVAPENGRLEVTMIDCGSLSADGTIKSVNPVIYDVKELKNVFSYDTTGIKETVNLSADVEAGKTYYITATGTKGRFSAAKFTPAGEVTATDTPTTDTPTTDVPAPVKDGISYDGTNVTVKADVTKGVLVYAQYTDGALTSVTTSDLTFASGIAKQALAATKGSKLMAWNSVEGMKPICAPYTVTGEEGKGDKPTTPTPKPNIPTTPTPKPGETVKPNVPTPTPKPGETTAPAATKNPNLPDDESWTILDADLKAAVTGVADGVKFGPVRGLSGYGAFKTNGCKQKGAVYTHTNGKSYNFNNTAFVGGSGNETKKCFYFTPKQACIVTVAYAAQTGRPVKIEQGGKTLASGEEGLSADKQAATITADIEDLTAGDVYILGGSSDKDIYGIFVDYYDPTVVEYHKLSGKLNYTGAATGLKVRFTDTKDNTTYDVALANGNYTVDLRQNRDYTISVVDGQGAVSTAVAPTLATNSVSLAKKDKTMDIDLVDIALMDVKGDVVVHDYNNDNTSLNLSGVQLTFTAADDATYTYTTGITDNKINVKMMPNHVYNVTATGATGYTLSPLSKTYTMAAGDTAPFKNILFDETLGAVEFTPTVKVGANKSYATVSDAIAAIGKMTRPAGESGRVTVEIDPGTYTEQITIAPNYVTLKAADAAHRPVLQWYYGIGYLYYSSASTGYYSLDDAVAKTKRGTVNRWGTACRPTGSHVYFDSIILKNTFNCEVTEEELADGVQPATHNEYSDTNNKPDRTADGYDAMKQVATERAAAITLDGGNSELYNCDFISSQDTFYTNKNAYVKNCYIEGGTDFIFGGNSVLFEDCTLAWHGYSDAAKGGYLTACQTSGAPTAGTPDLTTNGYIFRDTTITNSTYYPTNKFDKGSWGRNWGGDKCQVVFDGVRLNGVDAPGAWTKMGGDLSGSVLFVNDVTDKNNQAVDVSGTTFNPNGTMASKNYTIITDADYLGEWDPPHYDGVIVRPTADPNAPIKMDFTGAANKWISNTTGATEDYVLENGKVTIVKGAKYHNDHGLLMPAGDSIQIKVDGPTTIAVGSCQYSTANLTLKNGADTVDTAVVGKGNEGLKDKCWKGDHSAVVELEYNGPATTLTLNLSANVYFPYLGITKTGEWDPSATIAPKPTEAPAKTVNGTISGLDDVDKSAVKLVGKIGNAYSEITVTNGAFTKTLNDGTEFTVLGVYGGANAYTIPANTKLTTDSLAPVIAATKVVAAPALGTKDYDFTNGSEVPQYEKYGYGTFVLSDGLVTLNNMCYWNDHGLAGSGGTMTVKVKVPEGKTTVTFKGCQFAGDATKIAAVTNGISPAEASLKTTACNGAITPFVYTGTATELVFTISGGAIYLPGMTVKTEAAVITTPTDTPEDEGINVAVDLTNQSTTHTYVPAGVAQWGNVDNFGVDANGNKVAADSSDAVMVFTGFKWHSDNNGVVPGTVTVKVPGPVKISIGNNGNGNTVTVTDGGSYSKSADINKNGLWSTTARDKVTTLYYGGEATTLTITGGGYVPYYAVETVDISEIPNEKTATFAYDSEDTAVKGTAPEEIVVTAGENVTLPINRTLYKEGYTLTGWNDGTTTHNVGAEVTLDADKTFTAVFTQNDADNTPVPYGQTVTWDFQTKNGAPAFALQGTTGIMVAQANGVDVKLDIDTTNGKFNNTGSTDWVQVNSNTKLTVPVVNGTVITVGDIYNTSESYTINGASKTGSNQSETIATDINSADIIITGNVGYMRTVTVAYPAKSGGDEPDPAPAEPLKLMYNDTSCTLDGSYKFESDETTLGSTQSNLKILFTNPGSLESYNAINIPVGGGPGNNAGANVTVYMTSAAALADVTSENSTVIADKEALNNTSSTGWSDYKDTILALNLTSVQTGQNNLYIEFEKTKNYCGNFPYVELLNKTESAVTTKSGIEHGILAANRSKGLDGQVVTITAAPESGYNVTPGSLKVTKTGDATTVVDVTKADETTYTFVMPAYAVEISGEFSQSSIVTVTNNLKGGYITADKSTVNAGDKVVLSAQLWDGFDTVSYNVTYGASNTLISTTAGTNNSAEFTVPVGVNIGTDEINVTATFGVAANKKVLFFMDATDSSGNAAANLGNFGNCTVFKEQGYVKANQNNIRKWTGASDVDYYTNLSKATFYATSQNDNVGYISTDGTTVIGDGAAISSGTEKRFYYSETESRKLYVSSYNISNITAPTDKNTIYWTVKSSSNNTGFLGNWAYIILEYTTP